MIGLQHHPKICDTGITLRSEVREVRNLTGRDSVGRRKGAEIPAHVIAEIENLFDEAASSEASTLDGEAQSETLKHISSIPMRTSNTEDSWWGCSKEKADDVRNR